MLSSPPRTSLHAANCSIDRAKRPQVVSAFTFPAFTVPALELASASADRSRRLRCPGSIWLAFDVPESATFTGLDPMGLSVIDFSPGSRPIRNSTSHQPRSRSSRGRPIRDRQPRFIYSRSNADSPIASEGSNPRPPAACGPRTTAETAPTVGRTATTDWNMIGPNPAIRKLSMLSTSKP